VLSNTSNVSSGVIGILRFLRQRAPSGPKREKLQMNFLLGLLAMIAAAGLVYWGRGDKVPDLAKITVLPITVMILLVVGGVALMNSVGLF
jgi:hypothetical protein